MFVRQIAGGIYNRIFLSTVFEERAKSTAPICCVFASLSIADALNAERRVHYPVRRRSFLCPGFVFHLHHTRRAFIYFRAAGW